MKVGDIVYDTCWFQWLMVERQRMGWWDATVLTDEDADVEHRYISGVHRPILDESSDRYQIVPEAEVPEQVWTALARTRFTP